jgi:hypothetical protein
LLDLEALLSLSPSHDSFSILREKREEI